MTSGAIRQRLLERATIRHRLVPPIFLQQFMGAPGQHSSDFSALSPHPWNHHAVVAGRLMAQPGDHRYFGPLLNRNAFRPGDSSAADRRGMIGDGPCQAVGEISVICMKGQERPHCPQEVLNVLGLGFVTSSGVGFLLLCKTLRGSLCIEIDLNPFDGRCRCPHAS
jgi:hypothetical protein